MSDSLFTNPETYDDFLNTLKKRIRGAQVRAAVAINQELIQLYWQIGQDLLSRQKQQRWGAKVVERLAQDLKRKFPDMKGFSRSNLMYMRAFAEAYPDLVIVQRIVGQLPWRHNIALLEKTKAPEQRLWYAQKAVEDGWSRDILVYQIESDLYSRQGGAITNFDRTLPKPQSELAQQLIKDPYNLDFITLREDALERDLEHALVTHIRDFLLELGVDFAFMGSQYVLEVDGKEYRLDLLFYHIRLRCFIVIDLKMGEFEPEFSGKMNFYVSAVDDLLRHPNDQPTIGLILCKSKSKTTAEYALRNVNTPIGISTHNLPKKLQAVLPSVEQLQMELESALEDIETAANDDVT